MSTTATPTVFIPAGHSLSFGAVMRSEWIKLRSVRSTWWCFGLLFLITIGLVVQMASSLTFQGVTGTPTDDATQAMAAYAVTVSTDFGALIIATLGVLVIAGEYGTGMIRSTLTAVPKRLPALVAKGLVFAAATFVVTALAFAITVPISVALFSRNDIYVELADPQYWFAILGGVGYLVFVGLIAFSIGAILRNTAGGLAVAFGLILAAPLVWGLFSGMSEQIWMQNMSMLLPSTAGQVLFGYPSEQSWAAPGVPVAPIPDGLWTLDPWQGGLILIVWVVALFATASVLLKRRDA